MGRIVPAEKTQSSPPNHRYFDMFLLPLLRVGVLARLGSALGNPHPDDAPQGHAAGYDPDKVLIVGSGPAFGWGVTTHEVSLCGALARGISRLTGRGCDIELLTDEDLVARHADDLIGAYQLDHYDAIIFVLGGRDAIRGTSRKSWRSSITGLAQHALSSATATTDVFFIGIQPIRSIPGYNTILGGAAERHGGVLNRITKQVCAANPRTSYIPLPGQNVALGAPGRYRTAAQYSAWAAILAPQIAMGLTARITVNGERRKATHQSDELARQLTVDELPLPDLADNPTLKKLVELAQQAFRAEAAMFTIIDRERQLHLIRLGTEVTEIPRQHSFCDIALQQRGPLVVRDALNDERFQNNPFVVGEPHVRFYAGIPITAPSGERIGALCVVDSHPRNRIDDINLDYLRALAVLIEKELWDVLETRNG